MAANRSILIVDDDELSREVLAVLLRAEGYLVQSAASGDEALSLIASPESLGGLPDIVLTDLQMPGLAGNELAERLRSLGGASLRLLVMSAGAPEPSLVTRYDGFLSKPLCVEAFARALEDLAASGKSSSSTSLGSAILDEAVYARLAAIMRPEQIVEMYHLCLDDAVRRVEQMRSAVSLEDDESLRKQAHLLRGGSGMLGALQIRDLAAKMEELGLGDRTSLELATHLDDLAEACERLQRMLEVRWRCDA